jgi:hypothetical protein
VKISRRAFTLGSPAIPTNLISSIAAQNVDEMPPDCHSRKIRIIHLAPTKISHNHPPIAAMVIARKAALIAVLRMSARPIREKTKPPGGV